MMWKMSVGGLWGVNEGDIGEGSGDVGGVLGTLGSKGPWGVSGRKVR